jgi:hypothetical protein
MHNQNEIRDGIYERMHENGQLRIQETYRNGKREGISKIWYSNGQICTQNFYRDGRLEGSSKWWNADGKLKETKFYRIGILEGEFRYWDGGADSYFYFKNGANSYFYFKNGKLIYNLKKSGFLAVKSFLRIRRSLPDFSQHLISDLYIHFDTIIYIPPQALLFDKMNSFSTAHSHTRIDPLLPAFHFDRLSVP